MEVILPQIEILCREQLPLSDIDILSWAIIDFSQKEIHSWSISKDGLKIVEAADQKIFYDLASLTKPLTNSLCSFLHPEVFTPEMSLCLNHRGGLPAWGLLSKETWREQILSYPIKESDTLYSDFSALRVMLEYEKQGRDMKSDSQKIWDLETMYWTDLNPSLETLQNGFIHGGPNLKAVHDPNAFNLTTFCSHAGIFSTINGLARTLLNYQDKTDFIDKVYFDLKQHQNRFSFGWDRVIDLSQTLAGKGCGPYTFGHLGFTGTSIWIDPERKLGHVILSNATKYYWHNKSALNFIRTGIGQKVWNDFKR